MLPGRTPIIDRHVAVVTCLEQYSKARQEVGGPAVPRLGRLVSAVVAVAFISPDRHWFLPVPRVADRYKALRPRPRRSRLRSKPKAHDGRPLRAFTTRTRFTSSSSKSQVAQTQPRSPRPRHRWSSARSELSQSGDRELHLGEPSDDLDQLFSTDGERAAAVQEVPAGGDDSVQERSTA